jgi:hypothetical protein
MALGLLVICSQLARALLISNRCWAAMVYVLIQGLSTALTGGAAALVFLDKVRFW